jgi:hypothetical protein
MKNKNKNRFSEEHVNRLIRLAECFENLKLPEDFPQPILHKEDLPFEVVGSRVIFSSFSFTFTVLPQLFPEH